MTPPVVPELFTQAQLAVLTGSDTTSSDLYDVVHAWVLSLIQAEVGDTIADPPQAAVTAAAMSLARPAASNISQKSIGPQQATFSQVSKAPVLSHAQRVSVRKACGLPVTASIQTGVPNDTSPDSS